MQIVSKDIFNGKYNISCKYYLPETEAVVGIILGVHGFAGDKESSALEALAEKSTEIGEALICFDFPAHGKSPVGEENFTVANCVTDLKFMAETVRKEFPDAKKKIFATSFGGYISLLCSEALTDFDIVLRAPAVTMPEHILTDLLKISAEEFKEKEIAECGFERKIRLPYTFYEELQNNKVMHKDYSEKTILIIHGDKDEIVPPQDIREFCSLHPQFISDVVAGADHRFKKTGELEAVIEKTFLFWNSAQVLQ